MKISRVLITGASPDHSNPNDVLRSYMLEGFQQLLDVDNVFHCPLEQAAIFTSEIKPDVVISFGSCMPDDADYFALRYSCDRASAPLAFWLHDDPYEFDYNYKICSLADYIFSNDKWATLHYNHDRVYHLPLAASKTAHWNALGKAKDIDIFFCGVAFSNRIRLITDLEKIIVNYKTTILGDQWPEDQFSFTKNKRLSNKQLSQFYSRSKLTLNIGRDFHYANDHYNLVPSTPGPRTFEAAMAGTTQIYFVESLEIEEYYTPNEEIILFDSAPEFGEIVQKFIDGSLDATSIQAASQERTMNDHTYYSRAKSMLSLIENN